jgi:hypothetical protein
MNLCTTPTTKRLLPFTGEKSVAYGSHRRPDGRLEMKIAGKAMIDE